MFKTKVVLALVLALALGVSARADQVSTNITLSNTATGTGNTAGVGLVSSPIAGLSYTTTTQPLTVPGGAVYATGASLLAQDRLVPSAGGGTNNLKGDNLVITYAIQGTQNTVVGSGLSATFTKGVIAIYDTHNTAFNPSNPSTWGPGTSGATLVYTGTLLQNPGTTLVGVNPEGDPQSFTGASGQNQAAFNPSTTNASAGNFVAQNAGTNTIFLLPNPFGGFQVNIAEVNAQGEPSPGDAALDANFKAVAQLVAGQGFSTLTPFADTNFTANYNTNNPLGTGDTVQGIGFNLYPITFLAPPPPGVPEPASLLLWAGIAAGLGIYRRGRKEAA